MSQFRKRWGLKFLNVVQNGNCESSTIFGEDNRPFNTFLESVSSHELIKNLSEDFLTSEEQMNSSKILYVAVHFNLQETTFMQKNAFVYFCGWLYLKSFNHHSCESPLPFIGEEDQMNDSFRFSLEKRFDQCNLVSPPHLFIEYVKKIEEEFCKYVRDNSYVVGLGKFLFRELSVCLVWQTKQQFCSCGAVLG